MLLTTCSQKFSVGGEAGSIALKCVLALDAGLRGIHRGELALATVVFPNADGLIRGHATCLNIDGFALDSKGGQ